MLRLKVKVDIRRDNFFKGYSLRAPLKLNLRKVVNILMEININGIVYPRIYYVHKIYFVNVYFFLFRSVLFCAVLYVNIYISFRNKKNIFSLINSSHHHIHKY